MKKLVAFYSRNGENYFAGEYKNIDVGNTEKVAMYIAETIGADVFKIEQKQPYSSNYKECVAQAKEDFKTALEYIKEAENISGKEEYRIACKELANLCRKK